MKPPSTAREIAYTVLTEWDPSSPHAARALDHWFASGNVNPAERALATELVHGVMRRRETLEAILRAHVNRPLDQVEPGALVLLWLGAYQRVMLSGIPEYAVVFETTELAKTRGNPRWAGFINGVLRSLGRAATDEYVNAPMMNAVPISTGRYRIINTELFPDPKKNWEGYFSAAFSYPRWLVNRWTQRFNRTELTNLGFWYNASPQLSLRVNTLCTSRAELLAAFAQAGIHANAGRLEESVLLEQSTAVTRLPGFEAGWFAVQDESAVAAGDLLDPQPGERIWDVCSAPGGKTAHLAARMKNQGLIVATDVDAARLARVEEGCRRLGATIVETRLTERQLDNLPSESFDRVLVDVPCSNTGVLGKRPEARWRLQPTDIDELRIIQTNLLRAGCQRLAPGGKIVYSTCSIEPEENRKVIDAFLESHPEMEFVRDVFHVPGQPADGGYQALLQLRK